MNKERILDLADIIENDRLENVEFDMSTPASHTPRIHPECGTAACIAGYVMCAAYGNLRAKQFQCTCYWDNFSVRAARILGLNTEQRRQLFTPTPHNSNTPVGFGEDYYFTKERAVRTLRHFAETGKIDWRV
jgi:hypothetical protein